MPLKLSERPRAKPSLRVAVSYRMALPVTQIYRYANGDGYPICPRCTETLDREYMAYCDRCGQCLNWDSFHWSTAEKKKIKKTEKLRR